MSAKNKILRKPSFIFSVFWLLLNLFLAIFAYFIIPDKSQNANTHIPEIALKEPGFSCNILTRNNIENQKEDDFLIRNFIGSTTIKTHIAIQSSELLDENMLSITNISGTQSLIQLKKGEVLENIINKRRFLFGTDKYGRDIFSRIILGLRISFIVGLISVSISIVIGILLGLVAGYFGGIWDKIIMFLINSLWSIPTVLLVFAIVIGFGRSITVIFIAVGLTMWIEVARLVRGMVLQTKEQTYIAAAESLGLSNFSILLKHILPNIIGPVTVLIAANFAIAILIEAGLSYLGFGVQPPTPSLGNLLNENYGYALSGKLYMAIIPAIAIMLLVLSFNLVGNALSNIFDAKEH